MQKNTDLQKSFVILISCLLAIGIFFRCYNIERKVYWHDEVYTSIRTAAYNNKKIVKESFQGKIINAKQLLQYQQIDSEKNWQDSLDKLLEHPEHPPLYYLLSRFWQQLFGSSITITRSLSLIFSLLLIPTVYWLCQELFESSKAAWWGMGLVAISPLQIVYAQEAREYSLLLVTTTLTCIALIGAVKRNNWRWWSFYTVSLAINFYVSLIAAYLAIAQAIYIVILEKFRITKIVINFVISGIFSLILFIPWLWIIYQNYEILKSKTDWTNMSKPFIELLWSWELHLSSIFFDFNPQINGYISVRVIGFLSIFLFICYKFICLRNKPQTWLLIITMTFIPAAMLIVPDAINGGIKSIMTRYFLPSLLMIQIAVAYWLANERNRKDIKRSIVALAIILLGTISCVSYSQADTWWNKVVGYHNAVIAKIINDYSQPLIISSDRDVNIGNLISLSYLLNDNSQLLLVKDRNIPLINCDSAKDIFIWNIGEEAEAKFQAKNNCQLELIEGEYYPPLFLVKAPDI